ncbi:MAG TPA: hypothetical protein VD903_22715 [Pseudonocardia sp.]|nr:hypothetical protein [Pseudonocardia sp.]
MTRRAALVVALLLAAMLVAGGATALAVRGSAGAALPVPGEGAGPGEVELSPYAARHPEAGSVRAQLQRHYDAINERDYAQWRATVVAARAEALGEDAWHDAYATTRDGTIRVHRIDPAPDGGLLVRVAFVSTQAAEDAPPDLQATRICWRSTLPMRGAPLRIDLTGSGSSAREAC